MSAQLERIAVVTVPSPICFQAGRLLHRSMTEVNGSIAFGLSRLVFIRLVLQWRRQLWGTGARAPLDFQI